MVVIAAHSVNVHLKMVKMAHFVSYTFHHSEKILNQTLNEEMWRKGLMQATQ